jgi:hypothetical protein
VRCVETPLYPLRTRPLGEAAITSFIACPTKPRNSPARRNGTVPSPNSTNSFVSGWLRSSASSLSGGPARQSAKVNAVLSELMHQRPMVPSPTEPACSTTVTPSFSKSARRPRLCAASRGASPAGPPPIMTTPVRPRLNVTYFGVAHVGRLRHQNLGGIVGRIEAHFAKSKVFPPLKQIRPGLPSRGTGVPPSRLCLRRSIQRDSGFASQSW